MVYRSQNLTGTSKNQVLESKTGHEAYSRKDNDKSVDYSLSLGRTSNPVIDDNSFPDPSPHESPGLLTRPEVYISVEARPQFLNWNFPTVQYLNELQVYIHTESVKYKGSVLGLSFVRRTNYLP